MTWPAFDPDNPCSARAISKFAAGVFDEGKLCGPFTKTRDEGAIALPSINACCGGASRQGAMDVDDEGVIV